MSFLVITLLLGTAGGPEDSTIVARVGRFEITADELMTSYEFGPGFVKRRPDPLRRHLEFMINERLLALEAERLGLGATPFVRDRQEALKEDLAVEELYRGEVLSRVHVDDTLIGTDVRKAATTVVLRWLFATTRDEAQVLRTQLEGGAPFDSLFHASHDTSLDASARSLETTLLRLERDNPEIARAVGELSERGISVPVRGPDGYYIFRVDRLGRPPIMTETETTRLRHEAVTTRTRIIADGLADAYVKQTMKAVAPVIKADGFNILRALIADRGLARTTKVAWEIPSTFMTEAGPLPISASGSMVDRTLVTFGEKAYSVRDYAAWYDIRQFQFDTRSRKAFTSSVKKTIWKMVQDRLLSEEAAARGLYARGSVQRHSEEWNAKILYLAGRSALMRTIRISDEELRARYKQMQNRFRDKAGGVGPFEAVRGSLREQAFAEEEVRVLRERLAALRSTTNIWVNEPSLRMLTASVQPEARPLEAVFYKPGGTFPRVAYPTIDEAWERIR